MALYQIMIVTEERFVGAEIFSTYKEAAEYAAIHYKKWCIDQIQ